MSRTRGHKTGRSHNYKADKNRDFRKVTDRASQHSKRNEIRSALAHGRVEGKEGVPSVVKTNW